MGVAPIQGTCSTVAREEMSVPYVDVAGMRVQGDRDEVKLGHSAAVAAALGDGRLAVLPGTHLLPIESPELVTSLLVAAIRGWPPGLV